MSNEEKCIKSTDELKKIIQDLPRSAEIYSRVECAKTFIKEYLSQYKKNDAETIINILIQEHFSFKANIISSLIRYYRECHAECLAKEISTNPSCILPSWYKSTEGGLKFLPGVLAEDIAENANVIYVNDMYYHYENGVYSVYTTSKIQRLIQSKMLKKEAAIYQINDTEKQLQLLVQHDAEEINQNPYLLNLKNGIYDVKNDVFLPHDPQILTTIQINAQYGKAFCPRFLQFLVESTDGDVGQINLLQEIMGYCLIPVTNAQKCFILCGVAASGKSLFLNVLQDILLNRQNVSNVSLQDLSGRFKAVELRDKLVNIFADLPDHALDDNGLFKSLVGEDYINSEKKFKDPINFKSTARLLFSCNQLPPNHGDHSEGFFRRLLIIPFNHTVPEGKKDRQLLSKLREEADGILMFAIHGLRRLIANDFVFSETDVNRNELNKYRKAGNSSRSFVQDCCEFDVNSRTEIAALYDTYKMYCETYNYKIDTKSYLIDQILGCSETVSRGVDTQGQKRVIKGIRFKDN